MASRFIRSTAVLAKVEATEGVDAAPIGSANAVLVSNLSVPAFDAENVSRDLIRPHFGASEELVGTANFKCGFDVELAGSGTAGTVPAFSHLLRGCALAEVIATGYVEYLPITDGQEAITVYWYDSGVLHKLLGARGTVSIKLGLGNKPVLSFSFTGIYGGTTVAVVPSTTTTAFKRPQVVTDANSGDVTLGCTYSAGALDGGIAFVSRGIEIDLGNSVEHDPLLGQESVDVTDRVTTGRVQLKLTAEQEATLMGEVTTNATRSLGFVHGTGAGNIVLLHGPKVQFVSPTKEESKGKRLIGYTARFLPMVGNDELRLVFK